MNPIIDAVDLSSLNITELQKQKLKALFPEVFTEGNKIDFDRLKMTLGEVVEVNKERFGMSWAGKADCFKTIQQPSIATLVPARDESVDFDSTENVFIEGDNLEVLKLLQKSYLGKVKMIYIDPPYNTGSDFIYPDNYSENLETYLEYTGQVDGEGRKFSTNVETDGRFHSKWMNMMYPRLFLAKNLLREDGVIFISIDDNEVKNLRAICDEVFGEENFVDCIIWKKRYGGGAKEKYLVTLHEYVLFYAKNLDELDPIYIQTSADSIERYYKFKDENFNIRGGYRTHPLEATKSMGDRPNLIFPIPAPNGQMVYPKRQWLWSKERVEEALDRGELAFLKDKDGNFSVHTKQYLKDEFGNVRQSKAFSIIEDVFTQHGTNEVIDVFGNAQVFSFPKPTTFLNKLLSVGLQSDKRDIVLDFFAGSATTAHAVMDLNKEDGGNRKFICVQLPEPTDEKSEAFKAGYQTIAEISKERIRRAAAKIKAEQLETQAKPDLFDDGTANTVLDLGFRVFKLQKSNFKVWDANTPKDPEAIQQALELHVDHIDPQAAQEAILFELLLKSGFELTTPIKNLTLANKEVYSIADNALLICLDKALTPEVIRAMAELNPSRVICLDEGFQDNDQLKTNAVLIMKSQGVNDFRTV